MNQERIRHMVGVNPHIIFPHLGRMHMLFGNILITGIAWYNLMKTVFIYEYSFGIGHG